MIRISVAWSWLAVSVLAVSGTTGAERLFQEQPLFQSHTKGYHTVRIPSLIVTKQGTILAFCEGRKNGAADHGDIDLLMRQSDDGGKTWGAIRVVAQDGEHTIGNPCPVIDRTTGTIWLPYSRDNQQVLIIHSRDDGKTWSQPVEITQSVLHRDWHWVGPGPGHGIQLRNGRLLIPAWAGVEPDVPFGRTQLSYVFFSDDSGKTWRLGGATQPDLSDECEVVERLDGTLYMNARSRQGKRQRAFSTSPNAGATWTAVRFDASLPEPSCQGSIIRVTDAQKQDRNRIVVAHPASPQGRTMMTVRLSYDECRSWPVSKLVHQGGSAYSDLTVNHRREILLAYEADGYSRITLARFNLEWLTDGQDRVGK